MIIYISIAVAVFGYLFAAALFAVEAWAKSPTQTFLIVCLPGYAVYYALVNSERELPYRLILMASILFGVVIPVAIQLVSRVRGQ